MERRLRRELREHAERAGFGRVVRVHRQRRSPLPWLTLLYCGCLPAAIAAIVLADDGSELWRLVLLGYPALAGVAAAWTRWWPVRDPDGRHWFAVAEGGLVVWAPGAEPSAAAWKGLLVRRAAYPPSSPYRLVWRDGEQDHVRLVPPPMSLSGHRGLIRAAQGRRPVPPRPLRRAAAIAAAGLAAAVVVWFAAVPLARDAAFGLPARDISELSRICHGGDAFRAAPAYRGPGPHPLAVYVDGQDWGAPDYAAGDPDTPGGPPAPGTVQLLGCARLIGRTSPTPLGSCAYSGGYTRAVYQGRYRVDIYEVHTGRRVGSVTLDGDAKAPPGLCPMSILLAPSAPKVDNQETSPVESAYAAGLSRFVHGRAGG